MILCCDLTACRLDFFMSAYLCVLAPRKDLQGTVVYLLPVEPTTLEVPTSSTFSRILPSHITAFQKWALVPGHKKMASPLDYDPKFSLIYWSEHPKDKVFGANTNAFSSRFSGFSICHPIYHENTMLLATRHAVYSAAGSTEETATFMLLPS
jgi:hypothetical protein